MTARQKLDANEQREALFEAAEWSCVVCSNPLDQYGTPQLAHRCAKTRARMETYGEAVVNHPLNLIPVCSLRCNDACNIGNKGIEAHELMRRIIRVGTGLEEDPSMREEYRELRRSFQIDRPSSG